MTRKHWFVSSIVMSFAICVACTPTATANQDTRPQQIATTNQDERPQLDVPYVPTPDSVVRMMLKLADIKKGEKMYDLGCGDGRIVVAAAKDYEAKGVGIDLDPQRIRESNENARVAGVQDKVKFYVGDIFKEKFEDADVVTMYLLPDVNLKLRPVILDKLRPGARIVSHAFDMGDWKPDRHEVVEGRDVYFWVVPAKVAGTWTYSLDGQSHTLNLQQEFQNVSGTLRSGDRTLTLSNGKLVGDKLKFDVVDGGTTRAFEAKVSGDKITGSEPSVWTATKS